MGSVSQNGGFVYLLWGEGTQSFKIGFTRDNPGIRAGIIESNSPVPLRIVGVTSGTIQDERRMHYQLHQYRSHGEWFVLPEDVVWQVLAWFGQEIDKVDRQ